MQNFNSAELRPVELARAYLQKKMLKKPLREDAGADVLRDSPCSAHVSRKPEILSARITHRCRSLPPQIGAELYNDTGNETQGITTIPYLY